MRFKISPQYLEPKRQGRGIITGETHILLLGPFYCFIKFHESKQSKRTSFKSEIALSNEDLDPIVQPLNQLEIIVHTLMCELNSNENFLAFCNPYCIENAPPLSEL